MSKQRICINDVGVRDGFQIEKNFIPTETKIAFIDQLSKTGLAKIEATSFVHPKFVPNMADAETVLANIQRVAGVTYSALTPNIKGMERAVACHQSGARIDEMNLFMSASETHNMANVKRTTAQSLEDFAVMVPMAKANGIRMNGTVSTSFGCPFEGAVSETRVIEIAAQYLAIGFDSLAVTNPNQYPSAVPIPAFSRYGYAAKVGFINAFNLERLSAITTAVLLTNHDNLLEQFNKTNRTEHSIGDYVSEHSIREINLLSVTPNYLTEPTILLMRLQCEVSGEIKAIKEISGGYGLIEKILSPGRTGEPVDIEVNIL